jgi:hypothetical protein
MPTKLGGGGFRDGRWRNRKTFRYSGSFAVNGAGAPTAVVGAGATVTKLGGAGQYQVTLDKAAARFLYANASLTQAAAGTGRAAVLTGSPAGGNARTGATFTIVTQSTAGTAADIAAGPTVYWEAEISDLP